LIVYKGARKSCGWGSYDKVLNRTISKRETAAAVVKVRMNKSTENKGTVMVER
jgi:hypothetical protein